jgi:hypothetical protein
VKPENSKPNAPTALSSSALLGQSETWFSYDPCDGFETHDTETAARERAEKALQYEKDEAAGDGWNEEVTQICWGKVAQKVEETSRKQRPPDSELDCGVDKDGTIWGEWDEIVDYDLCPNAELCGVRGTSERAPG